VPAPAYAILPEFHRNLLYSAGPFSRREIKEKDKHVQNSAARGRISKEALAADQ
jgi:hypothetical protein